MTFINHLYVPLDHCTVLLVIDPWSVRRRFGDSILCCWTPQFLGLTDAALDTFYYNTMRHCCWSPLASLTSTFLTLMLSIFCYFPLDFYNDVRCLVVALHVLVLGVEERHLEAEIHQAFAHCVFDPFNVNSTSDVVPRWQPLQPIFVI